MLPDVELSVLVPVDVELSLLVLVLVDVEPSLPVVVVVVLSALVAVEVESSARAGAAPNNVLTITRAGTVEFKKLLPRQSNIVVLRKEVGIAH
ncbi:MAG: hypothetical protein ACRD3W_02700 [Terriglobales bacterium]